MVLEVRLQSLRKDLASPGVLMTCSVHVCFVPLVVLVCGFKTVGDLVSDKVCCVSMCSCVSLGSYCLLVLSGCCSVVLAVVFSVCLVGLAVLLAIPS